MTVDDGDRMIVYGVNAVTEALRAGQVRAVRIATASARVAEVQRPGASL